MDLNTFIVTVFCLVDDWLEGQKLRQRGPCPQLSDAEVLTIEIVGEFLGIDTDEGLYEPFQRHYGQWFPALKKVHRTTFLRQAANLWAVKEMLCRYRPCNFLLAFSMKSSSFPVSSLGVLRMASSLR